MSERPVDFGAMRPGDEPELYAIQEAGALGVLRNRDFLALWLSQVATQVGGNMLLYGLTIHIYVRSGSNSAVSLLFLAFLLPTVLFSPVAGVYVDRLDRRLILVVSNAFRALGFVGVLAVGDNLASIYLLSVLVATATTFFAPAEGAMIPRVVPREQLLTANGLFLFTMNASFGIGFALAGPLVLVLAGYQILLVFGALLYGAAALFCATLPAEEGPAVELTPGEAVATAEVAVASTFGQLREGIAYIGANRRIVWSLAYLAISSALIGVLGVLGPGFAKGSLGLREQDFVIVIIPLFAGLIVGILLLNQYGRYASRRRVIEGGLVALAGILAVLAVAGPLSRFLQAEVDAGLVGVGQLVSLLALVVVLALLAGLAYSLVAIPAQTQLQEELPEDVRGRVFGVLNTLISLAALLPIVIVGPLADLLGPQAVIFASGLLTGLVGLGSIVGAHPPSRVSAVPHGRAVSVDPVTVAGLAPTPARSESPPGPTSSGAASRERRGSRARR